MRDRPGGDIHYYLVCSRWEALIASQLDPEAFGVYMAVGSKKLARGHVIFFEIDPDLGRVTDHFRLDEVERLCVPHEDGTPKRSKYVSVYRVMEFVPPPLYLSLYLTTTDGRVLRLDESPYDAEHEEPGPNLFQELCPLIPLVASGLPPARFTKAMTDPANRITAPRLFFADLRLDRTENGQIAPYLPYADRGHLAECIREVEQGLGTKPTKTVSRTPRTEGFFRVIRRGFFLGDQDQLKFYRFPDRDHLVVHHAAWWRSASNQ